VSCPLLQAVLPIDVSKLLEAPAGCLSFALEGRHAGPGTNWAAALRTADASVTVVAAGSNPVEGDDIHALPSYDLSSVRTWTAGPVMCVLVRGVNAFAKLQHLTYVAHLFVCVCVCACVIVLWLSTSMSVC
jgi:hypothetical protein